MRVLIAHRWYGNATPSGEDRAVEEDIRELLDADVEVVCAMPEEAGPSLGGISPASRFGRYSPIAVLRSAGPLLDSVKPDLVHLHNPFPEYLGLVRELRRRGGTPLVHTVHNYRHLCPAGTAFRDGRPCEDCAQQRVPLSCAVHRCVNGGLAKSIAMGAMVAMSGAQIDSADLRIAVSDHLRSWLLSTSRPGDGPVVTLHNSVADPIELAVPPADRPSAPYVFFAGRLTETKGVQLLLEAVAGLPEASRLEVVVAGDGPLRSIVEQHAGRAGSRVTYLGQLSQAQAYGYMAAAAAVAVPSAWAEPFGLTVAESFGCGTPVLATDQGALPEVVGASGIIVEATAQGLGEGLLRLAEEPDEHVRLAARRRWETCFSPAVRGAALVEIYKSLLDGRA